MPDQDYIVNVKTLKKVREWQAHPIDGLIMRRRPNLDNGIQDRGLNLEGTWRGSWNLAADLGHVSLDG